MLIVHGNPSAPNVAGIRYMRLGMPFRQPYDGLASPIFED
jgi:hypothetical protein